jgi:hypothetical protein
MNTKQILEQLNDAANSLDKQGLHSEASILTDIMIKVAQQPGQSNLNTLYNNYQQNPQAQQPYQAPQQPQQQQPRQQAGRQLTDQDYNKLNKLYDELKGYQNKYEILRNDSYNKLKSGTPLQETNNVPNASIMLQQILDYIMNLYNQIDAIYKIDGIDAQDQQGINKHKEFYDSCKATIESLTRLHQTLKSSGKGILQQPK